MRKKKTIQKSRNEMTDNKRVNRALVRVADIFEDERLNMSEGLAVAEQIIVNAFGNKVDEAGSAIEVACTFDIAQEFLETLAHKVANALKGE